MLLLAPRFLWFEKFQYKPIYIIVVIQVMLLLKIHQSCDFISREYSVLRIRRICYSLFFIELPSSGCSRYGLILLIDDNRVQSSVYRDWISPSMLQTTYEPTHFPIGFSRYIRTSSSTLKHVSAKPRTLWKSAVLILRFATCSSCCCMQLSYPSYVCLELVDVLKARVL